MEHLRGRLLTLAALAVALSILAPIYRAYSAGPAVPPASFRGIASEISPSVVNIRAVKVAEVSMPRFDFRNSPFGDLGPDFFNRFFGTPGEGEKREFSQVGEGSGVIVSQDGYILTNNHVVADAKTLEVTLVDGRKLEGKLIGTDPGTEVAVIKVDAKDLKPATLGDSDKIEAGDWVIAVGNPFGLDHTVTQGIISAKGRSNLGLADIGDFIQTTAFINPGNSGGPLIDMQGEVIGINTAIITPGIPAFAGVGLAIPSNLASSVMDSLIKYGKVTRGWLGVGIQPLTPDLAQSFDLKDTRGVLVANVLPGRPAEQAGVKPGDIITEFNGEKVQTPVQLQLKVAATPVNSQADLKLIRDGKELTLPVKIAERTPEQENQQAAAPKPVQKLGLTVATLTSDLASELGYGSLQGLKGVVVTNIAPGSPAFLAGLRQFDVITEVGAAPVTTEAEFTSAIEKSSERGIARIRVLRGDTSTYLVIRIPG